MIFRSIKLKNLQAIKIVVNRLITGKKFNNRGIDSVRKPYQKMISLNK